MGNRLTGKNAKVRGVLARTMVSVPATLSRVAGEDELIRQFTSPDLNTPTSVFVDQVNDEVFVLFGNGSPGVLLVFNRNASGSVSPIRAIGGALTTFSSPRGLHVTSTEIFVADGSNKILVFNRLDDGDVAPARTISGGSTNLNNPRCIFADETNSEILAFSLGSDSLQVFNLTDNGNVAPIREITGLDASAEQFDVDVTNDEIFVSGLGRVDVYSRTLSGPASPLRTLMGAATLLGNPKGISVSASENVMVVSRTDLNPPALLIFSRTASGNTAPSRTIQDDLVAVTGFIDGVEIDETNGEIFGGKESGAINVYSLDSLTEYEYSNPRWNPNIYLVVRINSVEVLRTDYSVDYIRGRIIFNSPNLPSDVIDANNFEYMTMQDVADLFNWTIDLKLDTVDTTAFQEVYRTNLSTFKGWTAVAEGYKVSGYWFQQFQDAKEFYFEFFTDADQAEYFVGAGLPSWSMKTPFDAVVTEMVSVVGTGHLEKIDV